MGVIQDCNTIELTLGQNIFVKLVTNHLIPFENLENIDLRFDFIFLIDLVLIEGKIQENWDLASSHSKRVFAHFIFNEKEYYESFYN